MLERASGQFIIDGNVEDIFGGISGMARIARISQTCRFTGALEGESIGEYTAVLPREGAGSFQGFQRISGTLGEREGSFVVSVSGEYAKGLPRGTWSIVPKSGSRDFLHIRGGGSFSQSAGKPASYKLEFDLRKPRKSRNANVSDEANELIPGIDIVVDEELVAATAAALQPLDDVTIAKSPRRARPATSVIDQTAVVEPKSTPKRTRKSSEHVPAEAAPEAIEIESPPIRKRSRSQKVEVALEQPPLAPEKPNVSRKRGAPVIEQAAPEIVEPRTRARKPKLPEVAAEAAPVSAPSPKRSRTRVQPPVEEIAAESAPPAETPRKRGRKPATVEVAESVVAESAPAIEPKPSRRKKPIPEPPAPLQLPVAQDKPARQRKAKAA